MAETQHLDESLWPYCGIPTTADASWITLSLTLTLTLTLNPKP